MLIWFGYFPPISLCFWGAITNLVPMVLTEIQFYAGEYRLSFRTLIGCVCNSAIVVIILRIQITLGSKSISRFLGCQRYCVKDISINRPTHAPRAIHISPYFMEIYSFARLATRLVLPMPPLLRIGWHLFPSEPENSG